MKTDKTKKHRVLLTESRRLSSPHWFAAGAAANEVKLNPARAASGTAVQTTGVLARPAPPRPSAGTNCRHRPGIGGVIGKCQGFQALVAAAHRAAQGRAQRAAHHDR
jgi:hypothetical protein